MEEEEDLICQSCGMPIKNQDDLGVEPDGKKSLEYCNYCYMKGKFIEPDLTLKDMIETCAKKYDQMGIMPYKQAMEINLQVIPELKRWKYDFK
jgi:hypothetical protein